MSVYGAIPGLPSRPAQQGDEIVMYGIGFGAVSPNIPAGQLVEQANSLASFDLFIGGVPVTNVPVTNVPVTNLPLTGSGHACLARCPPERRGLTR